MQLKVGRCNRKSSRWRRFDSLQSFDGNGRWGWWDGFGLGGWLWQREFVYCWIRRWLFRLRPSIQARKSTRTAIVLLLLLLLLLLMMTRTMEDGGRKGEFMLFRLWNTPKPPTGKTKATEVEFPEYSSVLSVISWAEKVIT